MKMSDNGLKFTAAWETFRPVAYRATPAEKYLTIGYGHYGPDVKPGMTVTNDQALELLRQDMEKAEACANKYCQPDAFSQPQFDAICDCLFNVGTAYLEDPRYRGNFFKNVVSGNQLGTYESIGSFNKQRGQVMIGLRRRCYSRQRLYEGYKWDIAVSKGRSLT